VGVGGGRGRTAKVNRILVARNDGVNRRVLPCTQAFEAPLVLVINKGGGGIPCEEFGGDPANHGRSLLRKWRRRLLETEKPPSRERGDMGLLFLAARLAPIRENKLDVQILHIQRILFDELAPRLNVFAHQRGEDVLGSREI